MTTRARLILTKYEHWYNQIMDRARQRSLTEGFERHHVEPKSLGGTYSKTNIVKLTYQEHFLAHWLLCKFVTDEVDLRKMKVALFRMSVSANGTRIVAGWQFAIARKARAEANKGNTWGKKKPPGYGAKIAVALKGNKNSLGKTHSRPWSAKRRAVHEANRWHHTPENKAKFSATQRGKIESPETLLKKKAFQMRRREEERIAGVDMGEAIRKGWITRRANLQLKEKEQ